jgi:hypothetical protein
MPKPHSYRSRHPHVPWRRWYVAKIRCHEPRNSRSLRKQPVTYLAVLPLSQRKVRDVGIAILGALSLMINPMLVQSQGSAAKCCPRSTGEILSGLNTPSARTRLHVHSHNAECGRPEPQSAGRSAFVASSSTHRRPFGCNTVKADRDARAPIRCSMYCEDLRTCGVQHQVADLRCPCWDRSHG